MTFRRRLTVAAAVAVAVSVALASAVVFWVVGAQLRDQVDRSLEERAALIGRLGEPGGLDGAVRTAPGGPAIVVQIVRDGDVYASSGDPELPPSEAALPIGEFVFRDATVAGTPFRVLSVRVNDAFVVQLGRSLEEVQDIMRRLAVGLSILTVAGVGLAVVLGLAVTRTALAPIATLTGAVERVRGTGDLSVRVGSDDVGRDEVARLAASFDAMLAELESSVAARRQLVVDASHELRTPITVARANLDLLASGARLTETERERLLTDVRAQLRELTTLVADVVDLARGAEQPLSREPISLAGVAEHAISRARTQVPSADISLEADEGLIVGDEARVYRAVSNLLDNALKFGDDDARVEVTVHAGEVSVRDHGPGIASDDLAHVFDRFYRSVDARRLPGSGLGLAIVRQVAEAHGGSVRADNASDGGAVLTLSLPSGSP